MNDADRLAGETGRPDASPIEGVGAGPVAPEAAGVESWPNPWPKYHQIYLVMRQEILEGAFGLDEPLPSEQALCEQFGSSRITIRKAMEMLEREGMIARYRGRGTFVKRSPARSPVQASVSGRVETLVAMGHRTEVRLISFDDVAATDDVAAALDVAPGAVVQKAVRVRSLGGRPFSHLTTYVPAEIGRFYTAEEMEREPLLVLLERSGRRMTRTRQIVSAKLATPAVAKLLGNLPGEPLLAIRRIVFDERDRPAQLMIGLYRPDGADGEMALDGLVDASTAM